MQRTHKIIGLILILCALSWTVTAYVMAATPSQITYLSPGSLTETASIVIFNEADSTFFYKDGETGQITSSTNAATILQTALNTIPYAEGDTFPATYSQRTIYVKGGIYSIGTTQLNLTTYSRNFKLVFEPSAQIYYTGTDYAILLANAERFSIEGLNVLAPNGGALQIGKQGVGGAATWVIEPSYLLTKTGIFVEAGNEGTIRGGKIACANVQEGGSRGLVLGGNSTTETWADTITVERTVFKNIKYAIVLGEQTWEGKAPETITIHAGIYDCELSIVVYACRNLVISECSFENSEYAGITYIGILNDNTGGYDVPRTITIENNRFHTQIGATLVNALHISNYVYYLTARNNYWSTNTLIYLGTNFRYGSVDITDVDRWNVTNNAWSVVSVYSQKNRGYDSLVEGQVNTTITLPQALPHTNYKVFFSLDWSPSNVPIISAKGGTSFTIAYGEAAPAGAHITWVLE